MNEGDKFLEINLRGDNTFAMLMSKLKKNFSTVIKDSESFIFYLENNFAVCPNETVKDVYNNFSSEGKLVVKYSLTEAWG